MTKKSNFDYTNGTLLLFMSLGFGVNGLMHAYNSGKSDDKSAKLENMINNIDKNKTYIIDGEVVERDTIKNDTIYLKTASSLKLKK